MPATEHGENGGATGAPPSRLAWVVLALPILALLATGAWLGAHEGGYFIRDHGPISLLVTGLLASLAVARVSVTRDIRVSSAVAVTSIAVYAVWTTASISWASDRMEAWREAALTGTYATLVCLVVVLARMRVVPLRSLAAIAVAGPTVVTVAMSFQLVEDRAELFYTGRLLGTLGYFNGQAAFLLLPIWCGVWLAADRRLPSLARGTAVGALTFLAATSLLAQSRGSMLGVAVALIVYLALSPWRFRALVPLAVVAGLVVAALPDLTGVYRSLNDDGDVSRAAVTTAVRAIWVTSLLGALAGTVWAYVDRRLGGLDPLVRELGHGAAGPRRSRMRLLAVPAAALALAAAAGVTFQVRDVGADVQRAVDAVRGPEIEEQGGERARLANLSNNGRFDLWSAAIDVARLDPVRGVGAGNWEPHYYQQRDASGSYVRQPHNLALEVLSERGVIGLALVTIFVGGVLARVPGGRLRRPRMHQALVAALAATFVQWLLQAQLEWFWQIPAVIWLPLVAAGLLLAAPWDHSPRAPAPLRVRVRVPAALLAFGAAAVMAPSWLADRHVSLARDLEESDPVASIAHVDQAERFDPASKDAAVQRLRIARRLGDMEAADRAVRERIARSPEHWASYVIAAEHSRSLGDEPATRRWLKEARKRNPLAYADAFDGNERTSRPPLGQHDADG